MQMSENFWISNINGLLICKQHIKQIPIAYCRYTTVILLVAEIEHLYGNQFSPFQNFWWTTTWGYKQYIFQFSSYFKTLSVRISKVSNYVGSSAQLLVVYIYNKLLSTTLRTSFNISSWAWWGWISVHYSSINLFFLTTNSKT